MLQWSPIDISNLSSIPIHLTSSTHHPSLFSCSFQAYTSDPHSQTLLKLGLPTGISAIHSHGAALGHARGLSSSVTQQHCCAGVYCELSGTALCLAVSSTGQICYLYIHLPVPSGACELELQAGSQARPQTACRQ